MQKNFLNLGWVAILFFAVHSTANAAVWDIDGAHSSAKFTIKHMGLSNVGGSITGMAGNFDIDDKDAKKMKVNVTLDAKTLTTNNEPRDKHLKSPDFFDTTKYPTIKFTSTKVVGDTKGEFKLEGELTMHGTTKPVTFEAEGLTAPIKDMYGKTRRGFSATAKINRKEFGVSWSKTLETGGLIVGDVANVSVEVEMVAAEAAKPKG
jgi:polyisoprenoid-binding protein YceI